MLTITADSNIYISALNFGGPPDKVLDLARSGAIRIAISAAILDEVTRVLRDKFGWEEDAIVEAAMLLADFTERVEPTARVEAVSEDPADNRILECAVTSGSDYLVTGDSHLLRVGEFGAARIVRPADFLKLYAESERERG